ncbi:MAG: ABC transporter permease [Eubacteriales bacterium]|jgi:peptide/nickel transport system permease protein|nr:ABC transporter permease [Eubacteriales bacterium]MDD6722196.1 ABC transporter permease [Clostridiales bacterium]MDY5693248.1 ABC transporter permease [Eubacteriales bacterium]HZK45149.1 ABC transporter permease [Clostridia bacterium]
MKQENTSKTAQLTYKRRSQSAEIWRRFKKSKTAIIGLIMLSVLVLLAIFADVITPYDAEKSDAANRLQLPSWEHLFGTDELGRDIFTRIAMGTRISLLVGIVSVTVSAVGGIILGSLAGYYGGKVDTLIMRFVDIWMAIPSLLLNITIVAVLGVGLQNVMIAIGISSIPGYCRTIRASILSIKSSDFIEASKACGASDLYLIATHIIPNSLAPLIVQATLRMGASILVCASMSFMGLGVVPPTPEWGAMLSTGRSFLRDYPHLCTFPGAAIMYTVLAMNLLGDGVRDALDPKLKN